MRQSDHIWTYQIYNTDWDLVWGGSEYLMAAINIGFNESGAFLLVVDDQNPITNILASRFKIKIKRIPPYNGIEATVFSGELSSHDYTIAESGLIQHHFKFTGGLGILQRSINAFYAGTANKTSFTAKDFEYIVEEVVNYNAGHFATASAGRLRDSDNIGVHAVLSTPPVPISIDYNAAYKNVYDIVTELANSQGYMANFEIDTIFNRWILSFDYAPGSDLTDKVILSKENGTLTKITAVMSYADNKTVAIVGGGDVGSSRAIEVRTGATYNSVNSAEVFVDARQTDVATELQTIGDSRLVQAQKSVRYNLDVNQTGLYAFGSSYRDFYIADTVGFFVDGSLREVKVEAATLTSTPGDPEKLQLSVREV